LIVCLIFFSYEDIDEEDSHGYSALHGAYSLDVVKYLHENGGTNLSKGLRAAAIYGKLDTLKYLMDNQADINTTFVDGETVLMASIWSTKLEIVEYVLGNGADINAKNDTGMTALHQAALYEMLKIVKCLIEKGARINERDNQLQTPLHFAAKTPG